MRATPVASVTAPPTSTGGSGSGSISMPIFALLICVAFGALGLAAVEAQRQSIHRQLPRWSPQPTATEPMIDGPWRRPVDRLRTRVCFGVAGPA